MTGAAARDTVLIGATGAYAGIDTAIDKAILNLPSIGDKMKDASRAISSSHSHTANCAQNGLADVDFRSI